MEEGVHWLWTILETTFVTCYYKHTRARPCCSKSFANILQIAVGQDVQVYCPLASQLADVLYLVLCTHCLDSIQHFLTSQEHKTLGIHGHGLLQLKLITRRHNQARLVVYNTDHKKGLYFRHFTAREGGRMPPHPSFQSCLSRSVGPKNGFLKREKENCFIVATQEEEETNLFRCFLSLKIEQKETKWDKGISQWCLF